MPRASSLDDELAALASEPRNEELRAAAAMSLTHAGRHREACELLGEGLVNLSAHDGPTLPCLCRRCLVPEQVEASAEALDFVRRFVVARGRVLFYWAPTSLADDRGLHREVRARLERRLGRGERRT